MSAWDQDLRPLFEAEPATTERQAGTPPDRASMALLVGIIGGVWLLLALLGVATEVRTPFSDAHDWDWRVFQLESDGDWASYLWAPHNAQRIALARLATWWDVAGPRMALSAFLTSTLLIQLAAALSVALLALTSLPAGRWRTPVAIAVGLAALNVSFVEAASFPFAGVYIYAASMALIALALQARRGRFGLVGALACGLIASLGNSAGLAVWPALLIGAVLGPRPTRDGVAVAVVGGLASAIVLAGLPAPIGAASAAGATPDLLKSLSYFCGFLVLPLGSRPDVATRLLGAAVGLASGILVARALWRRKADGLVPPSLQAAAGLMVFGLLTAAMAALGRAAELSEPIVPVRYAPFAIAVQIGLVLALAPLVMRWLERRPRIGVVVAAATLVVWAGLEADGARRLYKSARHVREASVAFDQGDRSPAVVALIHPRPEFAAQVRAELRRRGRPN